MRVADDKLHEPVRPVVLGDVVQYGVVWLTVQFFTQPFAPSSWQKPNE